MVQPSPSTRLHRLHYQPKSEYGLQASTSIRSQLRSEPRSRKDPSTPHSDLNSSSRLRLLRGRDSDQSSSQRLNQQLEFTYRNHIQQLISQNETLKLQQRQAQVRAEELQMRLGRLEAVVPKQQNSEMTPLKVIFKYQLPIRKALEPYGFTREQASIDRCETEADIIHFLLEVLGSKASIMRELEREGKERLQEEQKEIGKVRESLKKLMETNELFKNREKKYKEKMEELRREWQKAIEDLKQKDKEMQLLESQKQAIQKVVQQQDMQIARLQRQIRSNLEMHKSSSNQIEEQITVFKNSLRETQLQNQILKHSLEEAQETIQNLRIKEKLKEDELGRTQREASKWKERYQNVEKQAVFDRRQLTKSAISQSQPQPPPAPPPPSNLKIQSKTQPSWKSPLQSIPQIPNSSIQISSNQQLFSSSRQNLERQNPTTSFTSPQRQNFVPSSFTDPSSPSFQYKLPGPSFSDLQQQVTQLYKTLLNQVQQQNKLQKL